MIIATSGFTVYGPKYQSGGNTLLNFNKRVSELDSKLLLRREM
jgi:hypothetical protein